MAIPAERGIKIKKSEPINISTIKAEEPALNCINERPIMPVATTDKACAYFPRLTNTPHASPIKA